MIQEDIIKSNIEKLLMEIEKLQKDLSGDKLEIANKITSIGSSLLSAIPYFTHS